MMYGTVEKEGRGRVGRHDSAVRLSPSHTIRYAREKTKKGSDLRVPMPVDIEERVMPFCITFSLLILRPRPVPGGNWDNRLWTLPVLGSASPPHGTPQPRAHVAARARSHAMRLGA